MGPERRSTWTAPGLLPRGPVFRAACRAVVPAALFLVALASSSATAATVDLAPVADTYIEAGKGAGFDRGKARVLKVGAGRGAVSYLAFDLSAVSAPVTGATLVLTVSNASEDAGRVYTIPATGWIEGTARNGAGPGLKWNDVDLNRDGVLDAADGSPMVPDAARMVAALGPAPARRTVQVDVTGAFDDGPGVYTLALMMSGSDTAAFRSREAGARRPILRLGTADASPPTSSPPPSPPPTLPPYACLEQTGGLVTLSAATVKYSNGKVAASTRIDARPATLVGGPGTFYPLTIAGGAGVCIAGARVQGSYDRTLSWDAMHDMNNAGVTFANASTTVDNARIENVEDGIRPRGGASAFVVRGSQLTYVRDDCVENDHVMGGIVSDSLFDGCYVGFSARPGATNITSDGRAAVWQIEDTLVRLEPMPGPRNGSVSHPDGLGHAGFFKWDRWDDPSNSRSPKLVLRNNVFRADRVGQEGAARMGIPPGQLLHCANNVMVWLGPGDYPAALPPCFTVTKDVAVWDAAVAAWKSRHR